MTISFVLPAARGARASWADPHIVGTFGFASLVAIPATGAVADRFGRWPFMLLGSALWTLVAIAFSLLERLGPAFYLLRLAQGLAFSLAFVATNALIVDLAPAGSLGRDCHLRHDTLLSHAVGPSLGEWISKHYGFAAMWRAAAASSVVAFVLFFLLGEIRRAPREDRSSEIGRIALCFRRGASGALIAGIATAMAFGTAIHFIPVFVRARGMASHAPFFVGYVAAAVGARLLAGRRQANAAAAGSAFDRRGRFASVQHAWSGAGSARLRGSHGWPIRR
jgi:MFS family permease